MRHGMYCQVQMLGPCTCGADEEAERDTKRLDWLAANLSERSLNNDLYPFYAGDLRAAADAGIAAAASSPAPEQQGSGIDGVETPTNGCTCGETAHEPVFHAQSCPYALGVKGPEHG